MALQSNVILLIPVRFPAAKELYTEENFKKEANYKTGRHYAGKKCNECKSWKGNVFFAEMF